MILELNKRLERSKKITVDSIAIDSFIVVHSENQYPEVNFLLKMWSNLISFQNNLDSFVVLSSEYSIYKNKNLKPQTN